MRVQHLPEVMHHPLADAGGQILLRIAADRVEEGDHQHGDSGEFQDAELIVTREVRNPVVEPAARLLVAQYVVQYDFQRPRLEQVGYAFSNDGCKPNKKRLAVRLQQSGDVEFPSGGRGHACKMGLQVQGNSTKASVLAAQRLQVTEMLCGPRERS